MATTLPIIFVLGCPACGKGTLSTLLSATYPLAHLSVGDLLRRTRTENTRPEITFIVAALEKQELIDSKYLFPILRDELLRLGNGEGGEGGKKAVLLDGFPRSREQLREFEAEFGKAVLVLEFHCEKEIAKARYLSRKLKGREGDDEAMFEKRYNEFEKEKEGIVFEEGILAKIDTGEETEYSWRELRTKIEGSEVWRELMG